MKQNILKLYISILVLTVSLSVNAQEDKEKDSIKLQNKFGLRVGADISRPIISAFNDDLKGIEIVADYRLNNRLFIATELGFYDRTTDEDYINFNSKGSYAKLGVNYNLYQNWGNMSNEIFAGIRYGYSSFSQTLNSYSPNYEGNYFPTYTVDANTKFSSLNAHWLELVTGIKVEVFNNLYLGTSVSLKKMISQKQPENFKNLYIPGFERVYLNDTGFGFNYTVSYLIPLYKKDK